MSRERTRPWISFFQVLIRRRVLVLALAALGAGFCALSLPSIPFETDPAAALPGDSPAVQYWAEMSQRFEAFHTVMVGLEEPGEGFSTEGLVALQAITAEIDQLKDVGVRQARSLSNMESAVPSADGSLALTGALEQIPRTPEERRALSKKVLSDGNLRGAFVSADGRAYLVIIQLDPERVTPDATERIREVVDAGKGPLTAVYYGAPFVGDVVASRLAERVPRLAAVGGALFLIPLLLIGWRVWAILVVLVSTGAALLLWFGLLGVLPVTISSGTGLAALAVVAVAMVLFARAAEERRAGLSVSENVPLAPRALLLLLGAGLSMAGVALVTPQPVTDFAWAAAVGMIAVLGAGLMVFVPAASWLRMGEPAEPTAPHRARPVIAMLLGFTVLGVGILGASQTTFRSLPRQLFFESDPVGEAIAFFDRHFGGADLLQIDARGDYSRPEDVARLLRLADCLEGQKEFSDVRSLGQVLAFLGRSFNGVYSIPKETESLGGLWFFLAGKDDIRSLVTKERDEAMVVARIRPQYMSDLEGVIAAGRRAVSCSIGAPGKVARARLEAIRGRLAPGIPAERVDEAAAAVEGRGGALSEEATKAILLRLQGHATSPEAPFEPSEEDWKAMADLLSQPQDVEEELTKVIAAAPGFVEMEYPDEVAGTFARELMGVREDGARGLRIDEGLRIMVEGKSELPAELTMRVRGVLADLQDGVSTTDEGVELTISGSPVVSYQLNAPVVLGVWKGAALIWALMAIFAWLITRRTRRMIVVAVEVGVATLYTFALGWLLGINMDPASAALYLLPPLLGYFATPWLFKRSEAGSPGGNRFVAAFTVALALGALSLLQAGVLPLVRVGAVTALGLLLVTLSSAVFRRIAD